MKMMIDLEPDTLPDTVPAMLPLVTKGPPDTHGFWIAYPPNNTQNLIEKLKELSCTWIAPRVVLKGPVIDDIYVDLIQDVKEAGFKVFPWKYCVPGDLEAEKVFSELDSMGCDGYIIDAEEEFEARDASGNLRPMGTPGGVHKNKNERE